MTARRAWYVKTCHREIAFTTLKSAANSSVLWRHAYISLLSVLEKKRSDSILLYRPTSLRRGTDENRERREDRHKIVGAVLYSLHFLSTMSNFFGALDSDDDEPSKVVAKTTTTAAASGAKADAGARLTGADKKSRDQKRHGATRGAKEGEAPKKHGGFKNLKARFSPDERQRSVHRLNYHFLHFNNSR